MVHGHDISSLFTVETHCYNVNNNGKETESEQNMKAVWAIDAVLKRFIYRLCVSLLGTGNDKVGC